MTWRNLTSAIVSAVPLSFIYKLQTKASWWQLSDVWYFTTGSNQAMLQEYQRSARNLWTVLL